ncbi:MAG TPA: hypothetical protein EYP73_07590 [Acidimicrobiia bacterium]|nr:hypothetical protein [Acidimicrobiia bacterium]
MTLQVEIADRELLRASRRQGIRVAAWLAVLTLVEYFIAVGVPSPLVWLLPFVAAKGWLIMRFFMHIRDLWEGEH